MRRTIKRRTPAEREASLAWKVAVGPCQVCPPEGRECDGEVRGHHAITQQALRKRGLDAFLWDTRNKVDACERAHTAHHNRSRPIPADLLPDSVWAFAADVGLTWMIERYYAESVAA